MGTGQRSEYSGRGLQRNVETCVTLNDAEKPSRIMREERKKHRVVVVVPRNTEKLQSGCGKDGLEHRNVAASWSCRSALALTRSSSGVAVNLGFPHFNHPERLDSICHDRMAAICITPDRNIGLYRSCLGGRGCLSGEAVDLP